MNKKKDKVEETFLNIKANYLITILLFREETPRIQMTPTRQREVSTYPSIHGSKI